MVETVMILLSVYQLIALIVMMNYIVLITLFIYGLAVLKKKKSQETKSDITDLNSTDKGILVSVIIAARNEEENINSCIECFYRQDYPKELFEVIIVNDQSTDATGEIINNIIHSEKINLLQLYTSGRGGKKSALYEGLKKARGKIILTTDADCIIPQNWISSFYWKFKSTKTWYITGPVMFLKEKSFFNRLQCLEFNSLIASTAGAIGISMPIMSNGASMGFRRELFSGDKRSQQGTLRSDSEDRLLNQYQNTDLFNHKQESGDDVFLLQNTKKLHSGSSIAFLDESSATVFTHAKSTLRDFIDQRIRWVSKSSGYRDYGAIYAALSVFAFNLCILISAFISLKSLLLLFIIKCFSDYLLIDKYSRIYGQRELVKLIPAAQPFIIIYTVLIGILGNLLPYSWKGRKIN